MRTDARSYGARPVPSITRAFVSSMCWGPYTATRAPVRRPARDRPKGNHHEA
jgi:hypothetical protein